MQLSTADIAAATAGDHRGPSVAVQGAAIDSRQVTGGELFVAVVAARDGHQFVDHAVAAGAAAVLVARRVAEAGVPIIRVGDTAEALLDVGRLARSRLPDRVVGITGSVGKTSTKDLLASALSPTWATAASQRSFNNELGVPLTMANAPDGTEAVVSEMGARGPGHIALLCSVARPTVGVVTRVDGTHLETFKTVEAVAAGKGELIEALPADGLAVLNADQPLVAAMASRSAARVVTFGGAGADVTASEVSLDDELRPRFRLASPWGAVEVTLAVRGRHQVANALAAAAAALGLGVPLEAVAAGLAGASLSGWRMQLERSPEGVLVLNDAYNANPTSMRAALEALAGLPARRRVAVLGTMAELGDSSESDHAAVGAYAASLGVEVIAVAAPQYGDSGVQHVGSIEEAVAALADLGDGDAILVKASRVAALERVADALLRSGPPS